MSTSLCDPCQIKTCDPCADGFNLSWLATLILWFIILLVLFYLIFFSLKPQWVLNPDDTVNTAKVLLGAVIAALILLIIIWLIKSCVEYSK